MHRPSHHRARCPCRTPRAARAQAATWRRLAARRPAPSAARPRCGAPYATRARRPAATTWVSRVERAAHHHSLCRRRQGFHRLLKPSQPAMKNPLRVVLAGVGDLLRGPNCERAALKGILVVRLPACTRNHAHARERWAAVDASAALHEQKRSGCDVHRRKVSVWSTISE